MTRVAVLGSTGSIGASTLDVVDEHPERYAVVALAAGSDVDGLVAQIERTGARLAGVASVEAARELRARVGDEVEVLAGPEAAAEIAAREGAETVVSAIVGAAGVRPTLAALEAGKTVALANKEALVVGGKFLTDAAKRSGATLLPVDSEHSAVHQCLRGERVEDVARLWLTASGGPFRTWDRDRIARATVDDALRHPTWAMGRKITVDSATLMNKGLEVLEAHALFGVPFERIEVVVHPQSIVHSMVEMVDGSWLAQLGEPDMRTPLRYALAWPDRVASGAGGFDPRDAGSWSFEPVDRERFPCLGLAYEAGRAGGAAPAVLNAANEVAVAAFLEGEIALPGIAATVADALERHGGARSDTLGDVLDADRLARRGAEAFLRAGGAPR